MAPGGNGQWSLDSYEHYTPLHEAAAKGNKFVCLYLISKGAIIDSKDK
jgi:hypothetical protein